MKIRTEKLSKNIFLYYLYMLFSDAVLIGAVLIPFFSSWAGMTQAQIQSLQSINMVFILLLEVPTGIIADVYGRKKSLIVGVTFSIFGIVLMTITPSFALFVIAEFILAFGVACKSGADTALIYDSLKQTGKESEAKVVMTKSNAFRLIGVVLGSLIGGVVAPYVQPNIVWRLSVVPFCIALCISFFLTEPKSSQTSEQKKWLIVFTNGVKNLLNNKTLLFHSLDMIVTATFAYFVIWFYQPKLELIGVSEKYFGLIHSLVILASASVLYTTGFWLKKFGTARFAIFTSLATAVGFFAAGLSDHPVAFTVLIVCSAGFGIARSMIFTATFNHLIGSEERSTVNSTISMLKSLAISFANPVLGKLVDINLNNSFVLLGFLTFMAGMFSVWVQTKFKLKNK